jgi:predicted CoA-binding protein
MNEGVTVLLNIEKYTDYRTLLQNTTTIAIVGLSPKEARPSNMVARYLIEAGYRILPVNPGQKNILGLQCYSGLTEITEPVDMVNIFRRSEEVYPIVEDAVRIGAKAIWMQQGIVHPGAAALAAKHGLEVIMDRCLKVEHMRIVTAV